MVKNENKVATPGRLRADLKKRSIFENFATSGSMGKSTELLGLIEFLHAAGLNPVLVSGDSNSQILKNIYATKNSIGVIDINQVLGEGVVTIDIEQKDGKFSNILYNDSIDGRDIIFDTKGGTFNSFVNEFGGLNAYYDNFSDDKFYKLNCMPDIAKGFQNLDEQYLQYSELDTETEIHIVNIFSKGKIGSEANFSTIIEKYKDWIVNHPYPKNITVHEIVFKTSWHTQESQIFFSGNKIREAYKTERSNNKILASHFLSERDREWSKLLFDQDYINELAQLPNPTDGKGLWGKILLA